MSPGMPTFACRGSHIIRPQFDELLRRETVPTAILSVETLLCLRPFANRAAAIFCSASRTKQALHRLSLLDCVHMDCEKLATL